jgi:hypothetical protein
MVTDSPNTSGVSFASAGAVRTRTRHATPLPAVQLAHNALMAALAAEPPHAFEVLDEAREIITRLPKAPIIDNNDLFREILETLAAAAETIPT